MPSGVIVTLYTFPATPFEGVPAPDLAAGKPFLLPPGMSAKPLFFCYVQSVLAFVCCQETVRFALKGGEILVSFYQTAVFMYKMFPWKDALLG